MCSKSPKIFFIPLFFPVFSRYEHFFGPLATHNLCVTNAMKDDLQKNWGVRYDLFAIYHKIRNLDCSL